MPDNHHALSRRTHLLVVAYGGTLFAQARALRALGVRPGSRSWMRERSTWAAIQTPRHGRT